MESLGILTAILAADATRFIAGTSKASLAIKGLESTTIAANMAIKASFAIGGAAVAALGVAAVKSFSTFNHEMTKSTSIMMDLSDDMKKQMKNLALELTGEGPQSASELAASFYYLASAGLSAEQQLKSLSVVQKFATAGAFDMSRATDLLTDAQSALGLTVKNPVENMKNMKIVSDILVKANTLANASVEQFSTSLTRQAGPAMKQYNIELTDGIAVLASYADQGVKAELAGNTFARAIRLLAKGATDNASVFEDLGIKVFDSEGEFRAFADIMADMEKAFANMSTEQRTVALDMMGFKARAQGAILPLIGASSKIAKYREELGKAGGITEKVAKSQMASLSNQFKVLSNNVNALFIEVGNIITEIFNLGDNTKSLADIVGDLGAKIRREMPGIIYFWKAFVIEIKYAFKMASVPIDVFFTNFGLIVKAAGENLGNFYSWISNNWEKLYKGMWEIVKAWVLDLLNLYKNLGIAIFNFIKNPMEGINFTEVLTNLGKNLEKTLHNLKIKPFEIIKPNEQQLKSLGDEIEKVGLAKEAALTDAYEKSMKAFANKIKRTKKPGEGTGEAGGGEKLLARQWAAPKFASALEKGTAEAFKMSFSQVEDMTQKNIESYNKETAKATKNMDKNIKKMTNCMPAGVYVLPA